MLLLRIVTKNTYIMRYEGPVLKCKFDVWVGKKSFSGIKSSETRIWLRLLYSKQTVVGCTGTTFTTLSHPDVCCWILPTFLYRFLKNNSSTVQWYNWMDIFCLWKFREIQPVHKPVGGSIKLSMNHNSSFFTCFYLIFSLFFFFLSLIFLCVSVSFVLWLAH